MPSFACKLPHMPLCTSEPPHRGARPTPCPDTIRTGEGVPATAGDDQALPCRLTTLLMFTFHVKKS
jgi:hypothetical protein